MTGCTFFDDQQPDGLSHWISITELSKRLRVSRNTISTAVKRAWANEEPWVKKEKATDGNAAYLIDTHHESYLSHQQRWQQQQRQQGESLASWFPTDHPLFPPLTPDEAALPPYGPLPYDWQPTGRATVLQQWPRFRQWLYDQGLQVFQNLLAEEEPERPWEWHWGELHGEGYESDEEAIIAALQTRLDACDAAYEEEAACAEPPAPPHRQPGMSWFRRND